MTEKELIDEIVSLAEKCEDDYPLVAAVLFHLAGSITAGPEWLRRTFDLARAEALRFIQFVAGESETRN